MDNCGTRVCGRAPFQHLVYPMPNHAGLGIHVTLDLGSQCKFGPDVSGWCVFRRIWTAIPSQTGHAFRSKLDSRSVATRGFWFLLC